MTNRSTQVTVFLTTDFGSNSPYLAQLKSAIWEVAPDFRIVDFFHDVEPQNIRQAAWFLDRFANNIRSPAAHLVVVDPGVGTNRQIIFGESSLGIFVGPDNGVLTTFLNNDCSACFIADRNEFWANDWSSTFHGRDIMAPILGNLLKGVSGQFLGSPKTEPAIQLDVEANRDSNKIRGQIMMFDRFGNAITNIRYSALAFALIDGLTIDCCEARIEGLVGTYGQREEGSTIALKGSGDWLELAIVNGNFKDSGNFELGTPVTLIFND